MVLTREPGEGDGQFGGPVAGRHEHVEGAITGVLAPEPSTPSATGRAQHAEDVHPRPPARGLGAPRHSSLSAAPVR